MEQREEISTIEPGVVQEQEQQVARWRYEELVRAGYSADDALALALRRDIDLHLACELLRMTCPPELAVRILL